MKRKREFTIALRLKGYALNSETMNKQIELHLEKLKKSGFEVQEKRITGH